MKPATDEIREIAERALAEDVGPGDVTSEAVVPEDARATASIVQKQAGVLFGFEVAAEVFRQAGADSFEPLLADGQWRLAEEQRRQAGPHPEGASGARPVGAPSVAARPVVARVGGPARALLAGERAALNFLGHLSGIATLTASFVKAVEGSGARILDTRKTTPGLRALEKAAVAAGGGVNHRIGLYDAILIKENHAALAGGVGEAVRRAREARPDLEVEVECRDEGEVRDGIEAGADRLLLDNMSPDELREAVGVARGAGSSASGEGVSPKLEASGGVTLENVAEVAATGVDFISVGALTHSAPSLDLSMELEPAE